MQSNQYTQVSDSQIKDPVIKLLKDLRTRKTKVTIPNKEDIIPSLWNDRTIRPSVFAEVNIGDDAPQLEKPIRFPRVFQSPRSPNFPTAQQKVLLDRLSRVPVYVVTTDTQNLVMAGPREAEETFFDWLYTKYYNWFVWTEDNGPISIVLFFVNKEDATLYLHDIGKDNPKDTEKEKYHIELTGLDYFYSLNRTSFPGVQARLVADFEEVYKLVSDYIPKHLHDIHPKQKYGKTVYKGNPIYMIKPATEKKFWQRKTRLIDYKITTEDNTSYNRNVFFKLEDAYLAWDHFCYKNRTLRLPLFPKIEIYNLESYLLDLESSDMSIVEDSYFVATQKSLKDLEQELTTMESVEEPILTKKVEKFMKIGSQKLIELCKGMLWVLTSDTLPTEDNSW